MNSKGFGSIINRPLKYFKLLLTFLLISSYGVVFKDFMILIQATLQDMVLKLFVKRGSFQAIKIKSARLGYFRNI